jgi:hypothetical protein
MNSNTDLRQKLHKISLSHPSAHPRLMHERIENQSIKLLSAPGDDLKYNCVMFALDVLGNQQYLDLLYQLPDCIHADTNFLKFLIDQGQLVIEPSGNLIIYSDNKKITHIGKVDVADRVTSKWGIGHLYEHAIFEIPIDYGDTFHYYQASEHFDFMSSFEKYIKQI